MWTSAGLVGPKRAKPDIEQPTPGIGTEDPLAWFRTILTAHPWGLWIGRVLMAAALLIVVGTFMSTIGFLPHQAQFLVGVGVLLVVLGGGALVPQFLARSKGTAAPAARPGPPRRPLLIGATSSDPMEGTRRSYLVFFDWDQADLSDRGRQVIATAAQAWRAMPGKTRIEVRGFSDTAPSTARAAAVSLDRAMAVSVELVRKGVPAGIIAASGHGVSRLLVATGPNMRERMNRRVEIILRE